MAVLPPFLSMNFSARKPAVKARTADSAKRSQMDEVANEEVANEEVANEEVANEKRSSERKKNSINRSRQKSFRIRKRWVILCLILLLLFFLPNIVCMTPLKDAAVSMATQDVNGGVEVTSVTAGWFGGVTLSGVSIVDTDGQPLVEIGTVETNKSVIGLMTGHDYGSIKITQPKIFLRVESGGSNLEQVFASYLKPDPSSPSSMKPISIELIGGEVSVENKVDGSQTQINDLSVSANLITDNAALEIQAKGNAASESCAGVFEVSGVIDSGASELSMNQGKLAIQARDLPVELISAAALRLEQDLSVSGSATTDSTVEWSKGFDNVVASISELQLARTNISSPLWLGEERLMIEQFSSRGEIDLTQLSSRPTLTANKWNGQCELFQFQADGRVSIQDILNLLSRGEFIEEDFSLSGTADIARIAGMLPTTLSIQKGVQLQSGSLDFQAFSRVEAGKRRLVINAEAQNIAATNGAKQFRWHQPVRFLANLSRPNRNADNESNGNLNLDSSLGMDFAVEQLKLESDSISIQGQGSSQQADFEARGDLGAFSKELSQFVDLSKWNLAGKFAGRVRWTPKPSLQQSIDNRPMELQASFRFTDANIQIPSIGSFVESQLDLQMHAKGHLTNLGKDQPVAATINEGTFQIVSGADKIQFVATKPTTGITAQSFSTKSWVGNLTIAGSLSSWHRRAKVFLPEYLDLPMAGQIKKAQANVEISLSSIRITNGNYEMEQFAFDGFGLQIREPRIVGQASLDVDFQKSLANISDLTVAGASLAARVGNTQLNYGSNWQLVGNAAFQADVRRTSVWVPSLAKSTLQFHGMAAGSMQIKSEGEKFIGSLDTTLTDLKLAQPDANNTKLEIVWEERTSTIDTEFSTVDFDRFDFQKLAIVSRAATASATGSIWDTGDRIQMDLSGKWSPDWPAISDFITKYSGQKVAFVGSSTDELSIQGPLFASSKKTLAASPNATVTQNNSTSTDAASNGESATYWFEPDFTIKTFASWEQGAAVGLPLGAAKLPVRLHQSVIYIDESNLEVGNGNATLVSAIDLRQADPVLYLNKGTQLTNVQLTPELCHNWIKYIAPPIADATRAQGNFSATFDQVRIPLYEMTGGSGAGEIAIESATVSSGPLADRVLRLAEGVKQLMRGGDLLATIADPSRLLNGGENRTSSTWVTMPQQRIPFQWQNGRVYTRGTTFNVDDVQLRSTGSVGMDQSVELVAEVPILDKWIGDKRELQMLKRKSIQVPVKGTLTRPQLDQNVLREISRQFVRENAGNLIRDQLNKQLKGKVDDEIKKNLRKLFGK